MQRTSTTRTKTPNSTAKKSTANTGSGTSRVSFTPQTKAGTLDRILNGDSIVGSTGGHVREFSKSITENGIDMNTIPDCNVSEISILKMLELGTKENTEEENDRIKLKEELNLVKKDLYMKNVLVERLMKENSDLRREMNDLVATVDGAKDQINLKMKAYTGRIQELEEELKKIRYENKLYHEQLQRITSEKSQKTLQDLEGYVGKYYNESRMKTELFYKSINQQIAKFLETSKEQYENFNHTLQNCAEGTPRYSSIKGISRVQTPSKARDSTSRASFSKAVVSTPQAKSRVSIGSPSSRETVVPRSVSNHDTDRRRRIATLHNLNDIAMMHRTENSFGSVTSKNESAPRTTKDLFSPPARMSETLKISTQDTRM